MTGAWAAELFVWLIGLSGLIALAVFPLSRLLQFDSLEYDRNYVWIGYSLEPDEQSNDKK